MLSRAAPGLQREIPRVGMRRRAVQRDPPVLAPLKIHAPIDQLLHPLHRLIHQDIGQRLISQEPPKGNQIAHRRSVGVAVPTIEANHCARPHVQSASAVAELPLDDHQRIHSHVPRLYRRPAASAAAADDENVRR